MADKKKKEKKNSFASGLLIVIFVICIVIVVRAYDSSDEIMEPAEPTEFETIVNYDFDTQYPSGPYEVMGMYNMTVKYLYGGEVTEGEIPYVIEQQRKLMSTELLNANPYDEQVELATNEILGLQEQGLRIMEIEQQLSVTDPNDNNISYTDVIQYTNTGANSYIKYTLIYEEGQWKILRWDYIGEAVENE